MLRKTSLFNSKKICRSLYEQVHGRGCTNQNKMPAFYNRYVDETLTKIPDVSSTCEFLSTLNEPLTQFRNDTRRQRQTFLGMVIIRNGPGIDTKVYVKPTDAVADPGEGSAPLFFRPGPKKNFWKKNTRKQAKKVISWNSTEKIRLRSLLNV